MIILQFLLFSLVGLFYDLWSLPCVFLKLFGWYINIITDTEKINIVRKRILTSSISYNEKAYGFIFGKWYMGFITHAKDSHARNEEKMAIYLLSTDKSYHNLTHYKTFENKTSIIRLYSRRGAYYCIDYNVKEIDVTNLEPTNEQKILIDKIIARQNKIKHTVVYIHGETGTGKSMTAILLTKILNGSICKTFDPSEPSNNLQDLIASVDPQESSPLIIVLEEVDIILKKIDNNEISRHNDYPIMIRNKTGWNIFLDDYNAGLYPNTILIMTSNVAPTEINKMDLSYIRQGRVDIIHHLKKEHA